MTLKKLEKITQKTHVILTKRGNEAIRLALQIAKSEGFEKLLLPQSGGWITYEQFGRREKFSVTKIPTINEVFTPKDLQLDDKTVVIAHTLAGYHTMLNAKAIQTACQKAGALFIEDICGSIGQQKPQGDIVVASFGNAKPLTIGKGGFIATNNEKWADFAKEHATPELDESDLKFLGQKIDELDARYEKLRTKRDEIIERLEKKYKIVGDKHALVIIVEIENERQKRDITDYCDHNGLEWTECPRYIRHDKPGISIEIKRME